MLLGGLWHGAAWTFLVWGAVHGALLVLHRMLGRRGDGERPLTWRDAPRIAVTFHAVLVAWVFFRAPDLAAAGAYLQGLFSPGDLPGWPRFATGAVAVSALLHLAERWARPRSSGLQAWFAERPARALLEAVAFGLLVGVVVMVSGAGGEFIYFQF